VKLLAGLLAGLGLALAGWLSVAPLWAQEAAAPELAQRLGCFACHGSGREYPARPLQGVGSHLTRAQLQTALTQPRRLHPGAKMPSYAYLPTTERQVLVDFLTNLK
jgi:mono/diheme cytochrome c family protein